MSETFNELPQEVRELFSDLKKNINYIVDLSLFGIGVFHEIENHEAIIVQEYWEEFCEYIKEETCWKVVFIDYNIDQERNVDYHIYVETSKFYRLCKRIRSWWNKIKVKLF